MSVYGSRVDEPALRGGLRAFTSGETSGHITTDEYFTDPALYEKYIRGTDIPCRIFQDKQSGETVYQVHFSYGPARSSPHPGSVLDRNEFVNSLNAHYLTSSDAMGVIEQHKNVVQSPLDLLGVTRHQILLNTQSIIRTTPENFAAVRQFQQDIQIALKTFLVSKNTHNEDHALAEYHKAFAHAFEVLRQAIAPDSTADQFAHDFHEFATVGLEPLETRKLQLITAEQQAAGMQGSRIDLRLAKISEFYNIMHNEDYNFVLNNCSHKVAAVERAGLSECDDLVIKNAFNHTVGYNELHHSGPLSPERAVGAAMFMDPGLGRHLETPVNVLRNNDALEKLLKRHRLHMSELKTRIDHVNREFLTTASSRYKKSAVAPAPDLMTHAYGKLGTKNNNSPWRPPSLKLNHT